MMFFDPKKEYENHKRDTFIDLVNSRPSLESSVKSINNQIHQWQKQFNKDSLNDSPLIALYSFNISYRIKYDIENEKYMQEYYNLIENTTKKDFRSYDFINSFYDKVIKSNLAAAFEENEDFLKNLNYIIRLTDISSEEMNLLLDNS